MMYEQCSCWLFCFCSWSKLSSELKYRGENVRGLVWLIFTYRHSMAQKKDTGLRVCLNLCGEAGPVSLVSGAQGDKELCQPKKCYSPWQQPTLMSVSGTSWISQENQGNCWSPKNCLMPHGRTKEQVNVTLLHINHAQDWGAIQSVWKVSLTFDLASQGGQPEFPL